MVPQSKITLPFNLPFKVEILPKRNSIILFPWVSTKLHPGGKLGGETEADPRGLRGLQPPPTPKEYAQKFHTDVISLPRLYA